MTADSKRGRPGGGDLSPNSSNVHPQGTPDVRELTNSHAPVGGLRYPAPGPGYVVKYADGETWDVVGFDRLGNPLINVAGEIVRANTFPLYEAQGFAGLLTGTYEAGSITEALGVAA